MVPNLINPVSILFLLSTVFLKCIFFLLLFLFLCHSTETRSLTNPFKLFANRLTRFSSWAIWNCACTSGSTFSRSQKLPIQFTKQAILRRKNCAAGKLNERYGLGWPILLPNSCPYVNTCIPSIAVLWSNFCLSCSTRLADELNWTSIDKLHPL